MGFWYTSGRHGNVFWAAEHKEATFSDTVRAGSSSEPSYYRTWKVSDSLRS